MKTSRRNFIKQSSLAVAAVALSNPLWAAKPKIKTGIQLYSVRDDIWKDPIGILKQIASMGYKNVEHAGYGERKFYGWTAKEFKIVLDDLGMKMPSGHTSFNKDHWNESKKDFTDLWKYTVEDAAICGQQFVISPWLDEAWRTDESTLKRYMDVFNKNGEFCKKSGMMFGYHNHHFEFTQKFGDKTVYDLILGNTDAKLVMQQLDIGNLYNGNAVALDVVKKWPGRFQSMHVKDEIATAAEGHEKYESTVLGKGIVNVKDVIDLGRKSGGTTHFIIEQEAYQGKTPLECVREDIDIMKKWGY